MEYIIKTLKEQGILHPNGEANIMFINQLSCGVITPFFQLAWERLNDPLKTLKQLNKTLKTLFKQNKTTEAYNVLRIAFSSLNIEFPVTLDLICFHISARDALMYEMTSDLNELIHDMS